MSKTISCHIGDQLSERKDEELLPGRNGGGRVPHTGRKAGTEANCTVAVCLL